MQTVDTEESAVRYQRFMALLILVTGSLLVPACQDRQAEFMAEQLPTGMQKGFLSYYDQGDYKAFAMAVDDDAHWVSATAFNASSQASADKWALYRCIGHRHKNHVASSCRIFARGNEYAD